MNHVIRILVLLSACFLIAPSLAQAEDATVSPEAARDIKAVSRDAAQKVKPELKKEAAKVPAATSKIAPANKPALEATAPDAGQRLQDAGMKKAVPK